MRSFTLSTFCIDFVILTPLISPQNHCIIESGDEMIPYPFTYKSLNNANGDTRPGGCRGKIPSARVSRLRSLWLGCKDNPDSILTTACTYDGLSSRLVEEAGFPFIFLSGFAMSSADGLPDTGYVAFQEAVDVIQKVIRQVQIPIMVDGDTGYGSPMNVKRTVQGFALAGAAGVMIEDQTWPKRCGHTKGKSVVGRGEAFARIQAAVDARNEGQDIFILARTDALMISYEEALFRARKFIDIGADAIFIEALPDKASMQRACKDLDVPLLANIVEGGMTEQLSAKELGQIGFAVASYPWRLPAAHLKAVRDALDSLKASFTKGAPPPILSYEEICAGLGFERYWAEEERYKFDG